MFPDLEDREAGGFCQFLRWITRLCRDDQKRPPVAKRKATAPAIKLAASTNMTRCTMFWGFGGSRGSSRSQDEVDAHPVRLPPNPPKKPMAKAAAPPVTIPAAIPATIKPPATKPPAM